MLNLIYFASLREKLGLDQEQLALPQGVVTVSDLADYLVAERGELWQQVLLDNKVMVAVNQEMCEFSQPVSAGDEVAFFPPVTGG